MQDRLFRLLASVGLVTLLLVTIGCFLIKKSIPSVAFLAFSWLMLFVVFSFSIRKNKIALGIRLVGVALVFIILPVGFFSGGGLNGGSSTWFVFCFVYIALMMSGRMRNAFWVCAFFVSGYCCYLANINPRLVTGHSGDLAYLDAFTSVVLMSGIICALILFQRNAFETQNRLAERQKKEIMELNRMQHDFFSSMSHEIRTPINTIIGLNEMTLREDISKEVAENSLNIRGASNMLLSLINDILDMSKLESGKMNIVNAPYRTGDMLSEIVNMIWVRTRDKNLAFHVEVDPSLPVGLIGDEVRIKQVLINLLNNAVKYTETGSVTLSVRSHNVNDHTVRVTFSVADTGIGIKRENVPYLFDAFHRMDEDKNHYIEGTGLGLSIVRQLVDLMNGDISVDSIYTKGSTFVVSLDQGIDESEQLGELNLTQHHALAMHQGYLHAFEAPEARVLIVDDNELNLLVASKLLRDTKVRVDTATSGEECLRMTLTNTYHVIFMDHMMPEMDGVECLHALRSQPGSPNTMTPVICLTANAGSDMIALYEREGFDSYLVKPVTGNLLEQEVLKFLPSELVVMTGEAAGDAAQPSDAEPIRSPKHKIPILISTDSVCDIPDDWIREYHIAVFPFRIRTEDGLFLDGEEIDTNGTLSYIEGTGKQATVIAPEVEEYVEFFAERLDEAQRVIHITPSKMASPAFAKATAASATFDNVSIFDSGQMSAGIAFMVMRALTLAKQGASVSEILQRLEKEKTLVQSAFLLDNTKYLKRNGRVPRHATIICDAFMLRPAVAATAEGMRMKKLYPGKRFSTWKRFIMQSLHDPSRINPEYLFLVYSGVSAKELQSIEAQVRQRLPFKTILRQPVSSASATMFGPGTFGLVYIEKPQRGDVFV